MVIENVGKEMYKLASELFPICRSITGDGVRSTFDILKKYIPLETFEVPSGTQVFDWKIPEEWNIRDAYILNSLGEKIVDFKENNLHVMGYSAAVDRVVTKEELLDHLYSLPEQPNAIPYITSYYKKRWGFCVTDDLKQNLKDDDYRVFIDSDHKNGHLTYGEILIPGELEQEVFISTYICHPSLANNELSGPVLATYLTKWLLSQKRRYSYRIVFVPETIGSLTYLSKHYTYMIKNTIAGFNLTCVGDDRCYSYLPSRKGDTLSDRVGETMMRFTDSSYKKYSYLDGGSDERQYCSPGINLPVVSLMRSKYAEYPEYHTSLDNLDVISEKGLEGSFSLHKSCIEIIEANKLYKIKCMGDPQLGKRGLYPTLSTRDSAMVVRDMMNVIAYLDGENDLIKISEITGVNPLKVISIINTLNENNLIEVK